MSPARFIPNPAFEAALRNSEQMRVLLEAVATAGAEEAKQLAGGHKRIEESVAHDVVRQGGGWRGRVFLTGKWAFIARFREFGTIHQPPRPFFRPGVETAVHAAGGAFTEAKRGS